MTRLFNDPDNFTAEALTGFARVHADEVELVEGGVVRRGRPDSSRVALVIGGGSGHYPAFAGLVGPGLAAAAVCGQVFTSPSAGQAYRVAAAVDSGAGVLFSFGNYAGDVLHFAAAEERLRAEGRDVRTVLVTDDIASASPDEMEKRRGIAGDFAVFKVAGAAAERGLSLDDVERLARETNRRTRSLGVAFSGCTFPGVEEPLFTVPEGQLSIGLGIHGEPGIDEVPMMRAAELAKLLVARLLDDARDDRGDRAAVLVNGLGTVKYEELFVLYSGVADELEAAGITIVEPECGELVTSLDMAGVSVTLVWLDDEIESLWRDPASSPAYRKGSAPSVAVTSESSSAAPASRGEPQVDAAAEREEVSEISAARAALALRLMVAVQETLHENRDDLGRIDAIAGDGDHGVGMVHGIDAAVRIARDSPDIGIRELLTNAGEAWSDEAGGTSGALWGAALRAMGDAAEGNPDSDAEAAVDAARAARDSIQHLGKAQPGDKTMIDALVPYVETLSSELAAGAPLGAALRAAASAATQAAVETARLRPALGRARPLAEKSLGHPDAGATSLALIAERVATELA
ncbi:dihydroxyacetone kinase family protein [Agreia sp. Leaf210]|uniref:dihydroxyacetone kinase family protein n=1 Tax=Agreia sp. Leaf210 TaxID=1735682 RepID=UPI0006F537A2|nr:dihydroxyacetone kinase family protein [Agreia sp. Leaf210]KQM60681.1 dihydroxyacetone kinase [Agreia sp. Leaf210]